SCLTSSASIATKTLIRKRRVALQLLHSHGRDSKQLASGDANTVPGAGSPEGAEKADRGSRGVSQPVKVERPHSAPIEEQTNSGVAFGETGFCFGGRFACSGVSTLERQIDRLMSTMDRTPVF